MLFAVSGKNFALSQELGEVQCIKLPFSRTYGLSTGSKWVSLDISPYGLTSYSMFTFFVHDFSPIFFDFYTASFKAGGVP